MNQYLTQDKRRDLELELKQCKLVRRPEILEKLLAAFALGDLPENAEYESARDDQRKNEERIQHIESILKYAKNIERSGSDCVELGAVVTLKNLMDHSEMSLMIVDTAEADINNGKISARSPIGAAMVGKRVGERFKVDTSRGETSYEIVAIA